MELENNKDTTKGTVAAGPYNVLVDVIIKVRIWAYTRHSKLAPLHTTIFLISTILSECEKSEIQYLIW